MILISHSFYGLCEVACFTSTEPQTERDTAGLAPDRGCRYSTYRYRIKETRVNTDRLHGHPARVAPAPVQGRAAVGFLSPFGQSSGHF